MDREESKRLTSQLPGTLPSAYNGRKYRTAIGGRGKGGVAAVEMPATTYSPVANNSPYGQQAAGVGGSSPQGGKPGRAAARLAAAGARHVALVTGSSASASEDMETLVRAASGTTVQNVQTYRPVGARSGSTTGATVAFAAVPVGRLASAGLHDDDVLNIGPDRTPVEDGPALDSPLAGGGGRLGLAARPPSRGPSRPGTASGIEVDVSTSLNYRPQQYTRSQNGSPAVSRRNMALASPDSPMGSSIRRMQVDVEDAEHSDSGSRSHSAWSSFTQPAQQQQQQSPLGGCSGSPHVP